MQTAYDWIAIALFAGLVVLFLQRSMEEQTRDHLWQYLIPAVGCAVANYAGNKEQHLVAIAVLIASAAYTFVVLKPFDKPR